MEIASLARIDQDEVNKAFLIGADGSWVAKANLRIMIPARYIEQNLGALEPEVYTVAIFALIVEDKYYAVSTTPNLMRLTPTDITYQTHEEMEYIYFHFPKGSVISPGLDLIMADTLIFYIYDEFIAKGNVPWFLSYDDLAKPYENARESAGVKVGANHSMMEMIIAVTVRWLEDKSKYFKETLANTNPIPLPKAILDTSTVVPLRSVTHGPTNTIARLSGSYSKEGIYAALANPSEVVEPIEDLLRR